MDKTIKSLMLEIFYPYYLLFRFMVSIASHPSYLTLGQTENSKVGNLKSVNIYYGVNAKTVHNKRIQCMEVDLSTNTHYFSHTPFPFALN